MYNNSTVEQKWIEAINDKSCKGGIAVYQGLRFEISKRAMQAIDIECVKLYIQDFNKFGTPIVKNPNETCKAFQDFCNLFKESYKTIQKR